MSLPKRKTSDSIRTANSVAGRSFTTRLERLGNGLGWVIARVPFDVNKAWPERVRQRVRGEVEGVPFRSSLFALPQGEGHFLLVNNKLQKAAGVIAGSRVRISMEPDMEERQAQMPAELAAAIKGDRELRRWFDGLNEYTRRSVCVWVGEPASAATRHKRAEQMAERLMLTMEGERELPPILRAAFARDPSAKRGWEVLTAAQRRGHLLGVFYYKEGPARDKRAAKALEEAVRAANKHKAGRKKPEGAG